MESISNSNESPKFVPGSTSNSGIKNKKTIMKRGSTLKLSSSLTKDSVGQMQKSIKIAQRESTQQRNNNKRNSFKQAISIRSPKTSSKGSPKRETKKVNFG